MNNIYKDAIAHSFVKLCEGKRVKDITVTEIIRDCGISRQTFYNHFSDKYDIMEYVFDQAASQATAAMFEGNGFLEAAIQEMLFVFQDNREYYSCIARMEGQNNFLDFFILYTINFYTAIVESLLGKEVVNRKIRYEIQFNAYGVGHMVLNYILSGMKEEPEEVAPLMVQCIPVDLQKLFVSVHALREEQKNFLHG